MERLEISEEPIFSRFFDRKQETPKIIPPENTNRVNYRGFGLNCGLIVVFRNESRIPELTH